MLDSPYAYNGANNWANNQRSYFVQNQPSFKQSNYQNLVDNIPFPPTRIPNIFNQYQQMGSQQQGQTNLRYNKTPETVYQNQVFNQMQYNNAGNFQNPIQKNYQGSTQNGLLYPSLRNSQNIFSRY